MKKIIIIFAVIALAILGGFLYWKFGPPLPNLPIKLPFGQKGSVTLTVWGLWEEENLMKGVILEYQKKHPEVSVNYERKSSANYRSRSQTQIKEGQGPDILMIHNSWLPMFKSILASAPAGIFSQKEYQDTFYPVAFDSFVEDGQIYAAPMQIDGLALYYNEDLLNGVSGKVPQNWQEFINIAVKMTVKDQSGIKTAGAAMGTASNVDHFSDILGLLLLQQPGVNMEDPTTTQAADVLRFYTNFILDPKKKTWDVNLPPSTQMFSEGRLGFYFAPSWRAIEIRAANPNLKFKIASVPQLVGRQVGWASFWAFAVPSSSKNTQEAWQFIKFLTSQEAEKLAYQEAAKVRILGQPYSRVDLRDELKADPWAGAFVSQGPIYKFWYLSSRTFDNGINDEMIKYWEDGVNATLQGQDPQSALQKVAKGVQQVLGKFNKLASPSP
ncbi:hypothetical protein A3B45_02540 [Candidatus Daviesbacteria bacterium RIFCSPLOWO2_01_FULL_39_12]|uniref:ABC transporter substrate-binding protein n=1 Tax=Candidatus Daviesbacteria bacterium RIFCSPLOWO2_01_FULL_39_12 TaxID=1797785 RepID=A0A1F5KSS9_9BACT|nr:MAG: hypothetical protein A3D79_03585 [Candidatus Daviesbacteria bacterium RIFCSPHIGHO2_02_FULL_39_8]OGE43884.1 MAG: hypothetical protein A3B45_02540 [Candidatus Daviesbacteria bacterium RIFCSPLOWO2_01_FULL_39_12]